MGFLYPWAATQKGRIPSPDAFDAVRQDIMKAMHRNSDVVAASVYGSVMRGDHTSRSDIDLAVVCRKDSIARVQRFVYGLCAKARVHHVVVSAHVHTVADAREGHHPFGPSYRVTMQRMHRHKDFVKGVPHQYFLCVDKDVRREMEVKLARYIKVLKAQTEKFYGARLNELPEHMARVWLTASYQAGNRPFHFYISFARWMLWWHQHRLDDDSKESVVQAFFEEPSFRHLHADFRSLRKLDLVYDELLAHACAGEITEVLYHREVYHMVATMYAITARLFERALTFMRRAPVRERERLRLAA